MENDVYVYIRKSLATAGLTLIVASAVLSFFGWVLFPYILSFSPTFPRIASIITLALALPLLAIPWLEKRKLARLKKSGTAYEAEVAWTNSFHWPSSISINAYVKYTDSLGEEHITRPRWYTIYTNFGWGWHQWGLRKTWSWGRLPIVPLSDIKLSAAVYVNPDDHNDYAVDLKVERRR